MVITNAGEAGESYCAGVEVDKTLYRQFLLSALGGAWLPSEMRILDKPDRAAATAAVSQLSSADYSLVVFCGHGHHSTNLGTTMVELRQGCSISSDELAAGSTKRTLILDCCRSEHVTIALNEALRKSLASTEPTDALAKSRTAFDRAVEGCGRGLVRLYGCSKGETASDDAQQGGVYSFALVEAVRRWGDATSVGPSRTHQACSVVEAHDAAVPSVKRRTGGTQTPTLVKPMSGPYFPLGVKVR